MNNAKQLTESYMPFSGQNTCPTKCEDGSPLKLFKAKFYPLGSPAAIQAAILQVSPSNKNYQGLPVLLQSPNCKQCTQTFS